MARRSKQLDADIAAALAKGSPHPESTPTDWKKLILDIKKRFNKTIDEQQKAILREEYKAAQLGQRAAEQAAAKKPSFVTGINLFALTQLVVKHGGPEFSNRLEAVDHPHIKRCLAAGLVESVGNKLRLTPSGREAVGDALIKDIGRESGWTPRENTFVPAEKRAKVTARDVAKHDAEVQRLEDALASLRS
jgi:hypothetical protein